MSYSSRWTSRELEPRGSDVTCPLCVLLRCSLFCGQTGPQLRQYLHSSSSVAQLSKSQTPVGKKNPQKQTAENGYGSVQTKRQPVKITHDVIGLSLNIAQQTLVSRIQVHCSERQRKAEKVGRVSQIDGIRWAEEHRDPGVCYMLHLCYIKNKEDIKQVIVKALWSHCCEHYWRGLVMKK